MAIDKNRTIQILSDFTQEVSAVLASQIFELSMNSTTEPIYVIINSNGGSITALRTIRSALKASGCTIVTIVLNAAKSCGSILFLQGDYRLMFEGSELVFHEPICSYNNVSYPEMLQCIKHSKKDYDFFVDEIVAKTNLSKKKLRKLISNRQYSITPKEAIDIGAATSIITNFSDIEDYTKKGD